ncbi:MAG: zinc ribbon domain-containing protein [Bacilli bacterium]|nr:zinc ribbon domain-containing protein [Bacilli bacterium]
MLVDEHNTTKTCCYCGYEENKDPSIREFRCTNVIWKLKEIKIAL